MSVSFAAVLLTAVVGAEPAPSGPVRPFESPAALAPAGKIDELVFARLKKLGLQPSPLCSDAVFLRRTYLDVIGTLPTAKEAREFLSDSNPQKRQVLIDRLLERDEFADYWAMQWSDVLRIKAEFPINLWPNAAQAYYHWIRTSIRENKPYDRFARELLTSSGSNFRVPPVNFYRAIQSRQPTAIAQSVALALMGARAEKWPSDRLAGMSAFFSKVGYKSTAEWKEEIVFFDPNLTPAKPAGNSAAAPAAPVFPDAGTIYGWSAAHIPPDRDPREVFADWLIRAENPWFARNIVNRLWYWLDGRGIVHEPDDIRPDNPPSNPELLAYLERELVAAHYDLKHVYRLILNSKTYQLSSLARDPQAGGSKPEAEANFAFYPLRRLEAEVLIDAICQVTGTTENYSSAIPEPFTFLPEGQRSIALPDGSITSPFLEEFGRPPRDTGLESERNNRVTAAQRLHMLNSTHIQRKLAQGPWLQDLLAGGPRAPSTDGRRPLVESIYLTTLSRLPTEQEMTIALAYMDPSKRVRREAVVDLAWALVNSAEFMYRH
jgi:hypothetical protein